MGSNTDTIVWQIYNHTICRRTLRVRFQILAGFGVEDASYKRNDKICQTNVQILIKNSGDGSRLELDMLWQISSFFCPTLAVVLELNLQNMINPVIIYLLMTYTI